MTSRAALGKWRRAAVLVLLACGCRTAAGSGGPAHPIGEPSADAAAATPGDAADVPEETPGAEPSSDEETGTTAASAPDPLAGWFPSGSFHDSVELGPDTARSVALPPGPDAGPNDEIEAARAGIARLRPRIEACFAGALRVDPDIASKVQVTPRIDPNGRLMLDVAMPTPTPAAEGLVRCLQSVIDEFNAAQPPDVRAFRSAFVRTRRVADDASADASAAPDAR